MKKHHVGVLFLLGMVALLLLVGCVGKKNPNGGDEPAAPITLAENGSTSYVIVRGNNAGASVVNAASNLWKTFRDNTGAQNIDLCDEYRYAERGSPAAIVVGVTADEVSIRLRGELLHDNYLIRAEKGNLYIIGGSDEATVNAVNWFIENYLKNAVETLVLEGDFDMRYSKDYPVRELTVAGTDVSLYRIVYDADLYYSKARAEELRNLIVATCGRTLEVVPDTQAATANEFLVGETNRAESQAVVGTFTRPNYYWKATISGSKVVIANQGVRTGEAVLAAIKTHFGKLNGTCDLTSENFNLSGDAKAFDRKALARPEGTDIRVMHSNVLGTLEPKANGYSEQQCCELQADTYLFYYPDVITFNEMMPHANMRSGIMKLLKQYYTFADENWLNIVDDGMPADATRICCVPVAYRKDAGLTALDSGFSYHSNLINYYGTAWVVFETSQGNRFLAASSHLNKNQDENGRNITTWVEDSIDTINVARNRYGALPVVMNGDWYFWQTGYAHAYNYMVSRGFADVSEFAEIKHSIAIGTKHDLGKGQQDGAEEDLIFITPEWFRALSHKNIVDFYTVNSSDHYPVLSDLKFIGSATAGDIPEFDDGKHLQILDEGPGGSGTWSDGKRR